MIARTESYRSDYPGGYNPHFDGGEQVFLIRNHTPEISPNMVRSDYCLNTPFMIIDDMPHFAMYGGVRVGSKHGPTSWVPGNRTTVKESTCFKGVNMYWNGLKDLVDDINFI